jgi:hypothetical protein
MTSEILHCHRCAEEFEIYYSFRDECQVVSGHCKCCLQKRKDELKESDTKPLDRALEILNEELISKNQRYSKVSKIGT